MPLCAYIEWFRRAASLVLTRCPQGSLAIFQQTDFRSGGQWVDKAHLLCEASKDCGAALLWHKVVADEQAPGARRSGARAGAGFSHLLCFSAAPPAVDRLRASPGQGDGRAAAAHACDLPDVLPRGRKLYAQGVGIAATSAVLRWVRGLRPPVRLVVDPFCGRGTVLALANQQGLGALGVDLDPGCVRNARRLDLGRVMASETVRPASWYRERRSGDPGARTGTATGPTAEASWPWPGASEATCCLGMRGGTLS